MIIQELQELIIQKYLNNHNIETIIKILNKLKIINYTIKLLPTLTNPDDIITANQLIKTKTTELIRLSIELKFNLENENISTQIIRKYTKKMRDLSW